MTLQVYRDLILDPVVKEWLQKKQDFVLEEDRDSGHGTGSRKQNIVQIWKKENELKHYQNYSHSPDLSPIKNIWGTEKAYMRRFMHWTKEEIEELATEA